MTRARCHVALTVERPPERTGGNVRPLTAPTRGRRAPSVRWDGLGDFLAALPRVFAARGRADRDIANRRTRSPFGDGAA